MTMTDTPSAVQEAADRIADAIGEDRGRLSIIDPKWSEILQDGVRVDLHIGRWRAESALSLEDFGIAPETDEQRKSYQRIVRLGHGFLLPEKQRNAAQAIEDRARQLLANRSYKTHWGSFVHCGAEDVNNFKEAGWKYKEWRDGTEKLQREYMALADEVEENWDDLQREVENDYIIIGNQNYDRLKASGKDVGEREDFVKAFVKRRMAKVPSNASVRGSWTFYWDTAVIPLAAAMAEDQRRATDILVERESFRAQTEMERDLAATTKRVVADGLQTFMDDLKSQLYAELYRVACSVLEGLQSNGIVVSGNVRSLRNLVESVESLLVWPDDDITTRINQIKGLIADDRPSDRTVEIRNVMQRIGAEARLTLIDMERLPERKGRLPFGIPETINGLEEVTGRTAKRKVAPIELAELGTEIDLSDTGRRQREPLAV